MSNNQKKLIPIIYTIEIEQSDFESLKIIRNYFGVNDVTSLEHLAFNVLDRIIKQNQIEIPKNINEKLQ